MATDVTWVETHVRDHTQLTEAEVAVRDALGQLATLTRRYVDLGGRPLSMAPGEAAAVAVEALRRFEAGTL